MIEHLRQREKALDRSGPIRRGWLFTREKGGGTDHQ